ncbi:MAG: amino acid ABC transporter substrate-binding protein [FCB group bacterium]|nr:amino acid ABC transporter substrate-binding protein [FCB group bacterium]
MILKIHSALGIVMILGFLYPVFGQSTSAETNEEPQDTVALSLEAYNQGKYRIALHWLETLALPDSSPLSPVIMELKVQCYRLTGQPVRAKTTAAQFFQLFPDHPLGVMVNMALGDMEINRGNFDLGLEDYFLARSRLVPPASPDSVDRRILNTIPFAAPGFNFDSLQVKLTQPPTSSLINLARAYQYLARGQVDEAALLLGNLDRAGLPPIYQDYYDKLLLKSYQPARPSLMVGAILPLSGEEATAGQTFMDGLKSGLKPDPDSSVELQIVVLDNGGDPLKTIALCNQALANSSLNLIIGPLNDINATLAANTLSGRDIALIIPNSVTDGLANLGSNIVQINGDLSSRGRAAARYARLVRGLTSMAVLAPSDNFGHPIVEAFIDEYEYLGGKILVQEWYSGKPENLRRQFSALRKKAWELESEATQYDEFLGMEIDSLEGLFNVSDETFFNLPETEEKSLTASDSNKVELNTIPGLFMPIHAEDVSFIGTQFPLYNLNTVIIGNEGWHNLDVLNQDIVGPHIQGLTTVAPFNADVAPDFELTAIGKEQRSYFIEGKDLARFLLAISPDTIPNRALIRDRIANLSEIQVGSMTYWFSAGDERLNQAYHVYQYKGKRFIDQGVFVNDSLRTIPPLTP